MVRVLRNRELYVPLGPTSAPTAERFSVIKKTIAQLLMGATSGWSNSLGTLIRFSHCDATTGDNVPQSVQTQATNLLSGIPFGYLIGAPLTAAIQGQGAAAMETVKFIEAVGFKTDGLGNTVPQTVTFTYTKSVPPTTGGAPTGPGGPAAPDVQQTYSVTVPLLAIVPIPFLRISSMTINFTANIQADTTTTASQSDTTSLTASVSASASFLFFSAQFNASVSNKSTSDSSTQSQYNVQYTMQINVLAQQDSMPAGLQSMLNILSNMITASQPAAAAAAAS